MPEATESTGRTDLQKYVHAQLSERGYKLIPTSRFKAATYLQQPIFSREVHVGSTIYATPAKCDFTLYHPDKWPQCLAIDCIWQQTGGSVHQKFPYFVLNVQMRYPYPTIIILDGGGYPPAAQKWLKEQVGNNLKHVFTMAQFTVWANKGGL